MDEHDHDHTGPPAGETAAGEAGWTRIDDSTMRWIGPPTIWGHDVLQIEAARGYRRAMVLKIAGLGKNDDPDDSQVMASALELAAECELPRDALTVLWHALGTAIDVMQAHEGPYARRPQRQSGRQRRRPSPTKAGP
jgi:hypothetical protein